MSVTLSKFATGSENVRVTVADSPIFNAVSLIVKDRTSGGIMSMVNVVIVNVDALPAASVTVMVLSLYVPSANSANVMVLFPTEALVDDVKVKLELIVPASEELKV